MNPAPAASILSEPRTELIQRLAAAEDADNGNARDLRVSLVGKEDCFEQAGKAEHAIGELLDGCAVPSAELADALAIPLKHLSPQAKADLIRHLQDSIALDDRREPERRNDYFSSATVDTAPYDAQKAFAAWVIKEFTIGEEVHWDTLQQAPQVRPQSN